MDNLGIVVLVLLALIALNMRLYVAIILAVLPEFLRAFENVEVVLFGAILILCMMFLPDGMAGGWNRLWARVRRAWAARGASGAAHG